jgi:hypothetical protein
MSYTLTAYAVSLDRLASVRGSRDRALVDAVLERFDYSFSQIDEDDDEDEDDGMEARPTCREALSRFVDGDDLGDVPGCYGYVYGYVFEGICDHVGESLEEFWSIAGVDVWMEKIDQFLKEANVPLRLLELVYSGCPIPIPDPEERPGIGHWSAEQVARALGPLRGLPIDDPKNDIERDILQIRRWVEFAWTRPGHAIIGFLA